MNKEELYNTFTGGDELPVKIPSPLDAWNDMRKKLDDEIPATGMLLPASIVTVSTGLINNITALFTLLLMGSCIWWLGSGRPVAAPGSNNHTAAVIIPADSSNKVTARAKNVTALNNAAGSVKTALLAATGTKHHAAGRVNTVAKNGIVVSNNNAMAQNKNDVTSTNSTPAAPYKKDSLPVETTNPLKPAGTDINNKTGSATGKETKDSNITKNKPHIQAGLLWNVQLPFSGAQKYFYGPNASSQPYRILLPGAWIALTYEKHLFTAEVNPFASTVFNPKPFVTSTILVNGQTLVTQSKLLNKVFGVSAALRYDYNITGRWWAGGGVQVTALSKGVATITVEDSVSNTASLSKSDWGYLSKLQFRTDAELLYKYGRSFAGLRAGVYFTPIAGTYGGPANPLQVELFYKLVLLNGKKKE